MTPSADRIRADVARLLEANGIAPRRALRAAVRLVRGLSLDQRTPNRDPCETLYNMRDRIAELLQDRGYADSTADRIAGSIIDWLRTHWGGRTLTRQWWNFAAGSGPNEGTGELLRVEGDAVKSQRGRELRAVVWGIMVVAPLPGICHAATAIAALVEHDWATIYLPQGGHIDRRDRDRQVGQKFAGLGSIDQVIALGVSQSRAYEINRRTQRERDKKEQPGLF